MDDSLSLKEAATKLGVQVDTLRRYAERGTIPAKKTLGRWRLPKRWVEEQIQTPGSLVEVEKQAPSRPKIARGDVELGPHQRGLLYFGQRLRDQLRLASPDEVIENDLMRYYPKALWYVDPGSKRDRPRDAEEESVCKQWTYCELDARELSIFPFFKQHLERCPCWALLDEVEKRYAVYLSLTGQAYQAVKQLLTSGLSNESKDDIEALAIILLFHGFWHSSGYHPSFDLNYAFLPPSDKRGWSMQIGRRKVGNKDALKDLQPMAKLVLALSSEIPSLDLMSNLAEAYAGTAKAIRDFQQSLTPDDRLRKLVISGRCDLCP